MHLFYNFSIRLYWLAIFVASNFNSKAKLWIDGRRKWKENLPKIESNDELIWFHCASLGEFDQGLPVMRELKLTNSKIKILVTFFSPSGMLNYFKRDHCVDYVCYLPLDLPSNVNFFLNHFSPKKIFFVKYEFWANYISTAQNMDIPVYSICSNFRPEQYFFKWYGSYFRRVLKSINYFFVQTEESVELLQSIGIKNVEIVGDTRFDNVISTKNRLVDQLNSRKINADFNKINDFIKGEKAIIIGSSWPKEEELIIPYIRSNPTIKFILAPHDIAENHVLAIKNALGKTAIRYTELVENTIANCLILDTVGHLSKAYYFGKLALIGGGFSGKLHNILEPAAFGMPILFGPNYDRFPEAKLFIEKKIAFEIKTTKDIEITVKTIFENTDSLSQNVELVMQSMVGATLKITKSTHLK
jgi:3-deoxy-D-manno-octulosonic-acid transferase